MSKYLIDEQGNVTRPTHLKNTVLGYSSEDVDKMIANGKFTEVEAAKIKANRLSHGQNLVTNPGHNSSASSGETPLPLPVLNFDEDDKTKNVSKQSQGDEALPLPSTTG